MDNPLEALKAMAREIVAERAERHFWPEAAINALRAGEVDELPGVEIAITAIMETSELCAKKAESFSRMKDKPDHADAPKLIASAIRIGTHLPETPHED